MLIFRNANHFIRKLDESKQTEQTGLYVTAIIFSQYERIRTCLLLENTSYSYRMLSSERLLTSFHTVTKETNNNQTHTY